ncbi:plasmid stabilization system protein [Desulfuromonas soudanensis]|uniref:Plasmid stabilization system protein n=1 Tax=Desulfuromonas soudanensis TaxID=1603606 RepID=A0A0M4D252_9BACT|nr:type II toxin-antitoxin system RelE/ParE family toxin [Desulfuromonas soudanensis]ALC16326.1 plasmid stabilization system protein [Desulfuromonas soudanensis]
MKHAAVRVTRHFVENLDAIEAFLHEANAEPEFEALLDDLFKEVIPALERFPDLGSDFFRRRPSSREAADLAATLRARLGSGTTLRELVRGDYLLLYSRCDHELHLLAIKHHRQLSFDFSEFWEF